MDSAAIERLSAPVPRYTSYPTAPHFMEQSGSVYEDWLRGLKPGSSLSLYVHIPYCDTLCWFCGCHTKRTLKYAPIAAYLETLYQEIANVADLVPEGTEVHHLHWGGGSPTILSPEDISELAGFLKDRFTFSYNAEFGVEIDPRDIGDERINALVGAGVNRVSIGVQDFDPVVQTAINRTQSYEETADTISKLRALGVNSVNLDLLYGLPHQSVRTVAETVHKVASLDPDRVSMFGYAHVPWMKTHQKMIDESSLPDILERYHQSVCGSETLLGHGYQEIGMDHFAKRDDELAIAAANGNLRRNFQGYTTDACDALIGFGASAISQFPNGYLQNTVATGEYMRQIEVRGLATCKGIELDGDDRMRAFVIERLMCDFKLSTAELTEKFGKRAEDILREASLFAQNDKDGLFRATDDGYEVTKTGKTFIRVISAHFDRYLNTGGKKHSVAV
ncbi:MAG: oxygen-independent coproporphyrinogen III oxidase [Hyphomicrobiales bacterium]